MSKSFAKMTSHLYLHNHNSTSTLCKCVCPVWCTSMICTLLLLKIASQLSKSMESANLILKCGHSKCMLITFYLYTFNFHSLLWRSAHTAELASWKNSTVMHISNSRWLRWTEHKRERERKGTDFAKVVWKKALGTHYIVTTNITRNIDWIGYFDIYGMALS